MSSKLYVGELSWSTTDDILRSAFKVYGTVDEALVVKDHETGRSRGHGYVTYSSREEAKVALNELNGSELEGRTIKVDLADARPGGGGGVYPGVPGRYTPEGEYEEN